MKTMYILRGSSYRGPHRDAQGNPAQTGKPDGMMIHNNGEHFTDNKASAKLFDTEAQAIDFYKNELLPKWTEPVAQGHLIFVVEVEVKPVVSKVTKAATLIQ